jgi:hypothetical protein
MSKSSATGNTAEPFIELRKVRGIVTEQSRKWNASCLITDSRVGVAPVGRPDELNLLLQDSLQNQRVVGRRRSASYCMFLLKRFEPQITAIQIANMKANPTKTMLMAASTRVVSCLAPSTRRPHLWA